MELSLPDMPFGMGRRRSRAAAHPGEPCRHRRRRKTGSAYAAPRDRILADASALLRGLADKKLLEL